MMHVSLDALTTHIVDGTALTALEQEHLAGCRQCRGEFETLSSLVGELALAKQSRVDVDRLAAYDALYRHVVEPQSGRLHRILATLQASLAWDGRLHTAHAVRSGASATYRLLYKSDWADVELLIDSAPGTARLQGELLPLDGTESASALIELVPKGSDVKPRTVTESDADGRFQLDRISAGSYRLSITPTSGPFLEIDPLNIS